MLQFLLASVLVAMMPSPITLSPPPSYCKVKACYYRNDAAVRPQRFRVLPEAFMYRACTHLIYAFAHIVDNKLTASLSIDEDTPSASGMYTRFNNLKESHKTLVTLLSVGGPKFGSEQFSAMSSTRESRKIFIDDAITFLRERQFDGLDLYWEFPAAKGGTGSDRENFSLLVQELRAAFHEESRYSGKKRLLLTAALAGDVTMYSESYEVDKIAKEVDYVSLMAYDLEIDQEEPFRNPSRIYGHTPDDKLNLKYIVEHYVQQGVPSGKIVIGIPLYGRGYVRGWYSMDGKDQFTEPTYAIKERGVVAYFQACQMVELGRKVGTVNGAPYLTHGMLWVEYDDVYSISEKIWFSQRHNLSGFMLWSVDMDDVTKEWCMGYAFNMIEAADRACSTQDSGEDYVIDSKQPRSIWNLKKDSLAVGKSDNFVELTKHALDDLCRDVPGEKQINYPESTCHLYIQCRNGTGEMAFCPFLQAFDPTHKHCDFFDLIEECQ